MSAYIQELNRYHAEQVAKRAEHRRTKQEIAAQAARERLTPLKDRLVRLLAEIPLEVQREGLSLSSLQTRLRGRWRGNCHPGELGAALCKLGFRRERRWRGAAGFTAAWYPAGEGGGQ